MKGLYFFISGWLLLLASCQSVHSDNEVELPGAIFVLGNSWSLDPELSSGDLFSSLMNQRLKSDPVDSTSVTHLGIFGEPPARVLERLAELRPYKPSLLIVEADGYLSRDDATLLPGLKQLFPDVPFWVLYLDEIPDQQKQAGAQLKKIRWINLQQVREQWSKQQALQGNASLHENLAAFLLEKLSAD